MSGRKLAGKRKFRQGDGVCLTTVRLAAGEAKREELAVKGLERRSAPAANHEEEPLPDPRGEQKAAIRSPKGEKRGPGEQKATIHSPQGRKEGIGEQKAVIRSPKGEKRGPGEQKATIRSPKGKKRGLGEQKAAIRSPKD